MTDFTNVLPPITTFRVKYDSMKVFRFNSYPWKYLFDF